MFSWEVGRINFYWETHEIQSPRQWGIKKLQTTEQVYKLYSFSNISHVFHLFYRLWAPLGKIKLNQFQLDRVMFSWEVGRINFYWETHEIQSPSQWGIKKLQTTEQVYKLYSFSNILRVFHLFVLTLCYGLCHSCASHIKRR